LPLFWPTVQMLPMTSSSMPAPPKPPPSGWSIARTVSQVAGSMRKIASVSLFVASHSMPKEPFQARPEMFGSAGLHWLSVSPGVGHDGPATR
jgi:hypothetical protein